MRLWTLHPKYLDARGLVALWREALLARAVLRGLTKGYSVHPQLARFRASRAPCPAINAYLAVVYAEARSRGYAFDRSKLGRIARPVQMLTTDGQLEYEWRLLLGKLRLRDPEVYRRNCGVRLPEAHPVFRLFTGPVESWERVRPG